MRHTGNYKTSAELKTNRNFKFHLSRSSVDKTAFFAFVSLFTLLWLRVLTFIFIFRFCTFVWHSQSQNSARRANDNVKAKAANLQNTLAFAFGNCRCVCPAWTYFGLLALTFNF